MVQSSTVVVEAEAEAEVASTTIKTPPELLLVVEVVEVLDDLQVQVVHEDQVELRVVLDKLVDNLETNLLELVKVVVEVIMVTKHMVEQVVMAVGMEEIMVLMEIRVEMELVEKVNHDKVVQVERVELV